MAEKYDAPADAPDEAPQQILPKVLETKLRKNPGRVATGKKLAERTGVAREAKKKTRKHQKLLLSKKRAAAAEPTNICFLA